MKSVLVVAGIVFALCALHPCVVRATPHPDNSPADTANQPPKKKTVNSEPQIFFTPEQDSVFERGKRWRVPPGVRLRRDFGLTDSAWQVEKARRANTPEGMIQRNLALTPKDFIPTERMKMDRWHEINPGALTNNVIPNIPRAGISIPFSARSLLGLDEDVSPTFSYRVTTPSNVSVIIYSVHGDPVVTLFDGMQLTGKHSMTWDMLDARGAPVPPGDYVVEVVVNNMSRMTKRIVVS